MRIKNNLNNKGFTLVELVVVVAILLLLSTIAVVSVTATLKKSDSDISEVNNSQIIDAAKRYVNDNIDSFNCNNTSNPVNVSDLIKYGYLETKSSSTKKVNVTLDYNCKATYVVVN